MKFFAKKSLAAASLVLAGLSVSGAAQAGVLSYSNLNILGIQLLDQGTGAQLIDGTDITVTAFTNSYSHSANMGSVAGNASGSANVTGAPVDGALECQGPSCGPIAENDFTQQAPYGGLHFSRADSSQSGTIVDGLGAPAVGATGNTVAENQLNSSDSAVSNSDLTLNSTFDFILHSPTVVAFDFDASGMLHVINDNFNIVPPSNAQAAANFSITITNQRTGLVEFAWSPDGFLADSATTIEVEDDKHLNTSRTAGVAGSDFTYDFSGSFYAHSRNALNNVDQYTLEISHGSNATATLLVPEPATLALLGLGLVGLGLRRKVS